MINLGKISDNKCSKEIILEEKENNCLRCVSHCQDGDGYTRIRYKGKHERLFRVLYILKYGEIPKDKVLRHKCDNTWCCNVEHLELGTQKDNVEDMIKRGRSVYHASKNRGELNKAHKLSKQQVKEIYFSNIKISELSTLYGVSKIAIRNIKNKKQWKWFTDTL